MSDTKCTFCPSGVATQTDVGGHPICDACAKAAPALVGKDEKAEKLAKLMLMTLDSKK